MIKCPSCGEDKLIEIIAALNKLVKYYCQICSKVWIQEKEKMTDKEIDHIYYRIKAINEYLENKEPNLMSIVWVDWNILKTKIKELIEENDEWR